MKFAAIGSNCIDYYKNLDGGKAFPGGGPVNMAVYARRLGYVSSYIGHVGNDEFGKLMKESISNKNVDTSHIHTMDGKTAVTQVDLIDGERILGDYDEGVLANYSLNNDDIEFICKHDIVVCDLWGKVESQIETLKEKGIKTAFDCATEVNDEACRIAIPFTDYLFFSDDESSKNNLESIMKQMFDKGPKLVIAMRGELGSLCYDGNTLHEFGIIECDNVVDTMGAGDSYIAGFLTSIIQDNNIIKAMETGAKTATETIGYFGAW